MAAMNASSQEVGMMKSVQIFRVFEVVMLSLVTSLSVAVDARAQDRRLGPIAGDRTALLPAASQVLVARGVGTVEPAAAEVDVEAAGPVPHDLTREERLTIVAGLGLGLTPTTTTWRLTPAQPMITGLADLYFFQVYYIDMHTSGLTTYGAPYARMQGSLIPSRISLRFRPPVSVTSKRYLIDCKVESGPVYQVNVSPGGASQTFRNTSHLVVLYEAVSEGDALVNMRLEDSNAVRQWGFYSCEITPLD
jgi:hypothetical protein